ncbi:MAG TPA: hypothetical protein V6C91_09760 [Coleofasciculaceae cyanobacterium]
MNSPWHIPLPLGEHTTSRVVVYFYKESWIPITFSPLVKAIELYRNALSQGMDLVLFPPNLQPESFDPFLSEKLPSITPLLRDTQAVIHKLPTPA